MPQPEETPMPQPEESTKESSEEDKRTIKLVTDLGFTTDVAEEISTTLKISQIKFDALLENNEKDEEICYKLSKNKAIPSWVPEKFRDKLRRKRQSLWEVVLEY